jgi:hypothetical protein
MLTTKVFFWGAGGQLNPSAFSPYITSCLTRGWVCILWICLAFIKCIYIAHKHVIENSSFCAIYEYRSSVSPGFAKQIMPILFILCYNGSLVTWMVVSLTTTKFKPLIFSVSGFALTYVMNIFMLMDPWLLPAKFCYIIIYIQKVEDRVEISDSVHFGNFQWCKELCFAVIAILRAKCLPQIPRRGKHKSLLI